MTIEEKNQLQQENEVLKSRIHDLELKFSTQKTLFEHTEHNLSLEVRTLQQHVINLQNDIALAHRETTEQVNRIVTLFLSKNSNFSIVVNYIMN